MLGSMNTKIKKAYSLFSGRPQPGERNEYLSSNILDTTGVNICQVSEHPEFLKASMVTWFFLIFCAFRKVLHILEGQCIFVGQAWRTEWTLLSRLSRVPLVGEGRKEPNVNSEPEVPCAPGKAGHVWTASGAADPAGLSFQLCIRKTRLAAWISMQFEYLHSETDRCFKLRNCFFFFLTELVVKTFTSIQLCESLTLLFYGWGYQCSERLNHLF